LDSTLINNTVSMEPDIPNSSYTQKANEVSALMAQVLKNPPDLVDFLRLQGAAIKRTMSPVGLSFFVHNGAELSCLLSDNVASLDLDKSSAQRDAFARAINQVADTREAFVLEPNNVPREVLHGQSVDEVPSPHQLPLFNQTPYFQFFIPIPLGSGVSGVLHVWFDESVSCKKEELLLSLQQVCAETELYFRSKETAQLAGEIGRVHAYTRFLESISGLEGLSSLQREIVTYAKEVSGADRVSLLVAEDYQGQRASVIANASCRYVFQDSSGIQAPHGKSEEAHALELVAAFLFDETKRELNVLSEVDPEPGLDSGEKRENQDAPPAAPSTPPRLCFQWLERDQEASEEAGQCSDEYFSVSPMNWATVLPLRDAAGQVCALVLFEGKAERERAASALLSLSAFSSSSGRVLGQVLFLRDRWSLRCARKWVDWRDGVLNTRQKRHWARWLIPLCLLACVLLFPVRFNIKAVSQVRPERVLQLPAQHLARIISVPVHEGESVKAGAILVELDTYELELELQRYQGEYLRSLTDSDRLLEEGDEAGMQSARLQSQKALAHMERIRYQLAQSSVRAPFDGLILGPKGLSQKVGQVVQVGESLVEIASPSLWEARVHLSEQNLVFLEELLASRGQVAGKLKLSSNPDKSYPLVLSSKEQLSYGLNVQGDEYYFDAVIPLETTPSLRRMLKAGFEGRVAFYVGWRPLSYVLFREVFLSIKVNWF